MESCISEKLNPVVGSNDIINVIGESLWTKEMIPTISIAENFGISNDNIKSYFFIVEVSQECNDNDAWNILQDMWKMNLLSSLFICRDTDKTVTLYTYNPYAQYAPHPWQHVNSIFKKQGQQWTLFKKLYSSGRHGCNKLFFDKTKLLNGSEVVTIRPYFRRIVNVTHDVDSIKNIMPYHTRMTFKEIVFVLNEDLSVRRSERLAAKKNNILFKFPNFSTTQYESSFVITVIRLWEELPEDIINSSSLEVFKNKIFDYLFNLDV
ncbi:Protein of unknown function [Cotesia congregata]|uniref:Uncharacterized protein n=1 Tax=Cotesia congregata TaxID=51543 RepID=A0A8J2H7V6_COTCN|nr:Protein of unknown function [Cotesia congregata]